MKNLFDRAAIQIGSKSHTLRADISYHSIYGTPSFSGLNWTRHRKTPKEEDEGGGGGNSAAYHTVTVDNRPRGNVPIFIFPSSIFSGRDPNGAACRLRLFGGR